MTPNVLPSHQKHLIFASTSYQHFMFFPNAFRNIFCSPFGLPRAPTSRRIELFGTVLGAPSDFEGPKIGQKIRMVLQNAALGADLFPRSLLERSWAQFLQICVWIFDHFRIIFSISYQIWGTDFGYRFVRRPELAY